MKIELEIRTSMSRGETFKALQIALDAAERLKHRMTDRELERLTEYGASLVAAANSEKARRRPRGATLGEILAFAEEWNRIAAGPPLIEGIAQ